ncbi:hypothetical protein K443DRAFT_319185 [Laccaria amethystina LaAM-08-1]|uniref:Uncharacterized protein n=1 Tax=Laccaria amethystina LaAM-08-1 TaxID=1095629 RepID=A0A0C9XLS8_9AGAR|nr:hypothetical protein K443DRAFT_319185 [Laccaria amethystina LaAM-08-1]
MELFEDLNSDAAMSDIYVISFQGDTYPGSDEDDPVALVNAAVDQPAQDEPDSKFTKRARITTTSGYEINKPAWLSINKDEIVYTDGVVISVTRAANNYFCSGYMVINSKGEKGFVYQGYIAID